MKRAEEEERSDACSEEHREEASGKEVGCQAQSQAHRRTGGRARKRIAPRHPWPLNGGGELRPDHPGPADASWLGSVGTAELDAGCYVLRFADATVGN